MYNDNDNSHFIHHFPMNLATLFLPGYKFSILMPVKE